MDLGRPGRGSEAGVPLGLRVVVIPYGGIWMERDGREQ